MPLRVALLAAGLVLGLWARGVVVDSAGLSSAARTPWGWVYLLIVGWSAMVAAVIVWSRRRRSALLLYAIGCWWFVAELADPSVGVALGFSLGLALASAGPALVTHLALSYPAGRLPGRAYTSIVATGYVLMVGVLGVAATAVFDPEPMGCVGCPANVLLMVALGPATVDQAGVVGLTISVAWLLVAAGAVGWRLVSARSELRGSTYPIGTAGVVFVGAWLIRCLSELSAGSLGGGLAPAIWHLEGACLIAIAIGMGIDVWRSRRARRELSRLAVQFTGATSGGLRAALARRLADPDLLVAYPVDGGQGHVDAEARPVDLSRVAGRTITRLIRDGVELACLVHRPGILTDARQVDDLVSSVKLALDSERLAAEDRIHLDEIRSSGARIVAAGDAERRRIERDLHDGAQQRMIALLLALRLIRADVPRPDLGAAETEVREAVNELRRLAHGVFPVLLEDAGLTAAFDALAESRPLVARVDTDQRFPRVVEASIYLLVVRLCETGPTTVRIDRDQSWVLVEASVVGCSPVLVDAEDRIRTLGGHIELSAAGDATHVTSALPIEGSSRDPR